jgi:primosomal protein N' (replication factor Y)
VTTRPEEDQLALGLGAAGRLPRSRRRNPAEPAELLPVARVCVDLPLPHLDRPFDYLVTAAQAATAVAGCRVRVRFAGQLVDGFLLERVASSDHEGRLTPLERVVSPEPVLAPEILRAVRDIADRYAGTLADVLRLAVPPRHGGVEKESVEKDNGEKEPAPLRETDPDTSPADAVPSDHWQDYPSGRAFLRALATGGSPRAVWTVLPADDWAARTAEALAACWVSGRGAVAVVPDARDVDRLDAALLHVLGPGRHVALSAALGPQERYRRWLAVRRGQVRLAIGTRAASFAPVDDLGLVMIWDDGDDLHVEQRAPYCHAREVLLTRAQLENAAVLVGAHSRTTEAQLLVETSWAREIAGARAVVRARAPRVSPVGDDNDVARDAAAASARLPTVAWRAARDALADGRPVLVQVPRRGYLPALSCDECRLPARCGSCSGPLAGERDRAPGCRWCGRPASDWSCPGCGSRRLRAGVVGARRTAEELGRAFPGVPVRTSGRDSILATVGAEAAVVVCTPGAEPVADGGYGAALLLDSWALLTRADLRATEEAMRRWANAIALVRSAGDGGRVILHADGSLPVVQALIRSDPAWFASRELLDRAELGFPPAVRMAAVSGEPAALADFLGLLRAPDGTEVLGPVPDPLRGEGDDTERVLLRVPRSHGRALAAALHAAAGVRSARKSPEPLRIDVDPALVS